MIPLFKVNVSAEASSAVKKTLESGMIGEGPKVAEFTKALQEWFASENIVLLNSCTSALVMALRLARINHESKVLVSPFTFSATCHAVMDAGASIDWADVESATLCVDTHKTIAKIREGQYDAVIVTAVGGLLPRDHHLLFYACQLSNTKLIIDAAHAVDTWYQGKHISSWGDYVAFSFQSIKHLTTGDGGALAIKDSVDMERAERLKWFGMSRLIPEGKTRLQHQMEYSIPEWGYKFHMNDIAASIGLANINSARRSIEKSRLNAQYFNDQIHHFKDGIHTDSHIRLLEPQIDLNPSWWVYAVLVLDEGNNYKNLMQRLANKGIESSPMWKWNNEHACFNLKLLPHQPWKPLFIPNGWWVDWHERRAIVEAING